MMKKTIGLLAALTITLTSMGAVAAGAEGYDDPGFPEDNQSFSAEESSTLNELYQAIESGDTAAEKEAVERYAIETDDPMYLKIANQSDLNVGAGGSDGQDQEEIEVIGKELDSSKSYVRYLGKYINHASKFDGMTKHLVIDVSQWQYSIDWNKVKADGIDYAIIRLGYRGYLYPNNKLDAYFKTNIDGAKKAGIKVGVYFFTQAITQEEAREEARFCIDSLAGRSLDLPLFYDTETEADHSARANDSSITKAQRTKFCTAFCEEVKSYGKGKYTPGVYSFYNYFYNNIDAHTLGKTYPMWLACYDSYTDYDGDYGMWQFTNLAKIDGIDTDPDKGVDMSVLYGDKFFVGSASDPEPPSPENPSDDTPEPTKQVNLEMPTGLGFDNSSNLLYWDEVEGADGYEIAVYNYVSETYSVVGTVTDPEYTIANIKKDKPYVVRAYTDNNGTKTYGAYSAAIYLSDELLHGLTAALSGSDVTLNWDKYDCDGYYVYRSTDGKNFSRIGETVNTTYTDNGIVQSQSKYYYLIQAYSYAEDGTTRQAGKRSYPVSVRLAPSKPAAPVFANCTADSITVSWNEVEGATGYQVMIFNPSSGNYTLKADVKSGETMKTKISELSAGNTYKIAVRAYSNTNGAKKFSEASDALSAKTIPAAPTNLTSSKTTEGVLLKWSAAAGAEKYIIYKKTNDGYNKLGESKTNSVEVKITGTGTKNYCVTAVINQGGKVYQSPYSSTVTVNGKSGGSSSDSELTNGIGKPKITGATYANGSLTISWTSAANATGYRLYRYNSEAGTYKSVKTLNGSSKTSYTINNITMGSKEKFKVKAYKRDSSGLKWGKASAVYTVKQGGTVLAAPKNVYTTATPTSVKITWDAVGSATSYNVYELKSGQYKLLGQVSKTSYSLKTGAGSGRTFAVAANNGTTVGNFSANSVANAVPSTPILSVSKYTSNSIKLKWTFPSNATGARLYMYNTAKKKYVSIKTLSSKKNALTVKNLNAASAYKFKIKAYTKSGTGITWSSASKYLKAYTSN